VAEDLADSKPVPVHVAGLGRPASSPYIRLSSETPQTLEHGNARSRATVPAIETLSILQPANLEEEVPAQEELLRRVPGQFPAVSYWVDVSRNHRVQVLEDGGVLWEHDTVPGYPVERHMVSPVEGATWVVVQRNPLTLAPSLHCDMARGGCGMHGWVQNGMWIGP